MVDERQTDMAASLERLILGRITADNWSNAQHRDQLYGVLRARLTATPDGLDSDRNAQFLSALASVSANIEAAAVAANDHEDFLDLVKAAREGDAPRLRPRLPPAPNLRPSPAMTPSPERVVVDAPPSASREAEARPVKTIPILPFALVAAIAAAGFFLWPAGGCTLTSTACIIDRQVSSGPSLTEEEARLLRIGLFSMQVTPTHVFGRLRVTNGMKRTLHAVSPDPLRFSSRVRAGSQPVGTGRPDQFNRNRIELTHDILPGATVELPLMVARPPNQSSPVLDVTFVVEGRFWAFTAGVEPLSLPLQQE